MSINKLTVQRLSNSGHLSVYVLTQSNKRLANTEEGQIGLFYSGHCYVAIDSTNPQLNSSDSNIRTNDNKKQGWSIYFWQGIALLLISYPFVQIMSVLTLYHCLVGKDSGSLCWPTFLMGLYPALEKQILQLGFEKPLMHHIYQVYQFER